MIEVKIEMKALTRAIRKLKERVRSCNTSAIVGYGTDYGLYVHEDMQRPPQTGQRKFLTEGEKQVRKQYLNMINEELAKSKYPKRIKMGPILVEACHQIRVRSQQLVPYDTGRLHNSAFEREDPL